MATMTIRNIDPAVKERLRLRAARHGHSMEAEVRRILIEATRAPETTDSLASIARELFGPDHGIELGLAPREPTREPPSFDQC
jgi:plasmid stability protein